MALPTRFTITWRKRPTSPRRASGTAGSTRYKSSSPLAWARRASGLRVSPRASRSRRGIGSRLSLPASILEKSRMSLRIARRESADDLTVCRYSNCSGFNCVSRASSVMPMIPFMGVRISWLMFARNSALRPAPPPPRDRRPAWLLPHARRRSRTSSPSAWLASISIVVRSATRCSSSCCES